MTTNKLQATIKTKDGIRVFNLSIGSMPQATQDELKAFFAKKEYVTLEELLLFCVSQTDANTQLQQQNKALKEESLTLQKEIEKLCLKLDNL